MNEWVREKGREQVTSLSPHSDARSAQRTSECKRGEMKKRVNSRTRIGSLLWPVTTGGCGSDKHRVLFWDRCWEHDGECSEWQMVLKLLLMEKKNQLTWKKKSQKRIKILKDSVCLYNSVIEAFNRYLVETSGLCFPPIFHFMYKNILSKAVSPVQCHPWGQPPPSL